MKLFLILLCGALLGPTVAQCQVRVHPPRYGLAASWEHSPGGSLLIGYSREQNGRWIVESYLMQTSALGAEPIVFIRRALDSYEGQEQIQWADSRTCVGLIETLGSANHLDMPTLTLPIDEAAQRRGLALGVHAPPPADGGGPYVFWAPIFGPTGMDFQMSANRGPWREWADEMERILAPCWQSEQPAKVVR